MVDRLFPVLGLLHQLSGPNIELAETFWLLAAEMADEKGPEQAVIPAAPAVLVVSQNKEV